MRIGARSLFFGLALAVVTLPALAAKPELTLETVRQEVADRWKGVRDLTVVDHATRVEYHHLGIVDFPKMDQTPMGSRPNVWRGAPGFEYLDLWQGGRNVTVAFDGAVTKWQGQRTAFNVPQGRIRPGNHVPFDDLSFAYYVGRFGRYAGLAHFLGLPTTQLTKSRLRIGEVPCCRVEGIAEMELEGEPKTYEVTLDLAAPYGWLPMHARFVDQATGFVVREYRARTFSNLDGFPFPQEAKLDIYEAGRGSGPQARLKPILTSSLVFSVEKVAVNQGLGPADFALHFAPGIDVLDERTGQVVRTPSEPVAAPKTAP